MLHLITAIASLILVNSVCTVEPFSAMTSSPGEMKVLATNENGQRLATFKLTKKGHFKSHVKRKLRKGKDKVFFLDIDIKEPLCFRTLHLYLPDGANLTQLTNVTYDNDTCSQTVEMLPDRIIIHLPKN